MGLFGWKSKLSGALIPIAYILHLYLNSVIPGPLVHTENGRLQGILSKSRSGREFFSFMGIPYARPPIGKLRFESPLPAESWEGVRDASTFGSICSQFDMLRLRIDGDENCLFVNVYTPSVSNESKLPVMVWFHGGIFMFGGGNGYSPLYWLDQDIVLVTVNYRLGALGFLNTGKDGLVRGNMGLKDQTMALKWVKRNIRSFGGNSDSVTIFGESAGAASVHYHMISPLSKGLFHRGISQSGNALAAWALNKNPVAQMQRFASQLNCVRKSNLEIVNCLKDIPAVEIVKLHEETMKPLREWITVYAPTVEYINDSSTYLPTNPLLLFQSENRTRIPWIAGVNSEEGLMISTVVFRNESMIDELETDFANVMGRLLNIKDKKMLNQIYEYYHTSNDKVKLLHNYTNLFSDRMFNVPLYESVKLEHPENKGLFLYFYDYKREYSLAKLLLAIRGHYPVVLEIGYAYASSWIGQNLLQRSEKRLGACHADELALFFPVPWSWNIKQGDEDYEISVNAIKLWTSFATGNHDNGTSLDFHGFKWKPFKNKQFSYLKFDNHPDMVPEPFKYRRKFWKSIVEIE